LVEADAVARHAPFRSPDELTALDTSVHPVAEEANTMSNRTGPMTGGGRLRIARPPAEPSTTDPEPLNTGTRFAATVGTLTHRLIAEALAHAAAGHGDPRALVLPRSQALAAAANIGHRTRACRIAVAAGAAIYLERFLLPDDWAFDGAEIDLAPGVRADVVWSGPTGVVIDELKTADGRVAGRVSAARDDQVMRLLEAGTSAYGDRLLGVRLIFLGAAGHSLLHRVGGPAVPLADDPELGPQKVVPWP
jgi:hypothetical protein